MVRKDLKLPKGKLAAQVSHASVEAVLKSEKKLVSKWKRAGMKKIVLKVEDLDQLLLLKTKADDFNIKSSLIEDAGHTVIEPGTITCLGLGPDEEEKIDKVTGTLKMI